MHRSMARVRHSRVIAIPRTVTHGRELVILTRDAYEQEVRRSREIAEALHTIAEGEREYQAGRTLKASSLEEALKLHAKRSH